MLGLVVEEEAVDVPDEPADPEGLEPEEADEPEEPDVAVEPDVL